MAAKKKSSSSTRGSTTTKSSAKKSSPQKRAAKASRKATGPVKEGTVRKGTDAPSVKKDEEQKVGDATARVSLKPSDAQPGPSAESEGRTTDTRGSSEGGKSGKSLPDREEVRPRGAEEQTPTASDTASKQPIRQTDLPLGHEIHEVDGEKVEVYAAPERFDPVELPPHKRDTLLKDTLRHEGEEGRRIADAPVRRPEGGDWEPVAAERTDNDLV